MREQPAALARVGQGDPPQPAAVDAGDAVVLREPLVDERVVGVEQLVHAAVAAQGAGHEELGLVAERLEQRFVVVGIDDRVDDDLGDPAQVQPLGGEVVHQRIGGAGVGEHPPGLSL